MFLQMFPKTVYTLASCNFSGMFILHGDCVGGGSSSPLLACFALDIVQVKTNHFTVDHFIKAAIRNKVYPCLRDYSFKGE